MGHTFNMEHLKKFLEIINNYYEQHKCTECEEIAIVVIEWDDGTDGPFDRLCRNCYCTEYRCSQHKSKPVPEYLLRPDRGCEICNKQELWS